jgi:hypothetical protein
VAIRLLEYKIEVPFMFEYFVDFGEHLYLVDEEYMFVA